MMTKEAMCDVLAQIYREDNLYGVPDLLEFTESLRAYVLQHATNLADYVDKHKVLLKEVFVVPVLANKMYDLPRACDGMYDYVGQVSRVKGQAGSNLLWREISGNSWYWSPEMLLTLPELYHYMKSSTGDTIKVTIPKTKDLGKVTIVNANGAYVIYTYAEKPKYIYVRWNGEKVRKYNAETFKTQGLDAKALATTVEERVRPSWGQ